MLDPQAGLLPVFVRRARLQPVQTGLRHLHGSLGLGNVHRAGGGLDVGQVGLSRTQLRLGRRQLRLGRAQLRLRLRQTSLLA